MTIFKKNQHSFKFKYNQYLYNGENLRFLLLTHPFVLPGENRKNWRFVEHLAEGKGMDGYFLLKKTFGVTKIQVFILIL